MPIAIVLLGVVVKSLGQAGLDQRDVEQRTQSLTNGQIGLERMTREIRQASWLYFRSSSVVDLSVRVRATATASGDFRLVRFDCSTERCVRYEGANVAFPPPAQPTFATSSVVLGATTDDGGSRYGQILGHDVFRPTRVDPHTGVSTADFVSPDFVLVRLRLSVPGREESLELEDGVSLRNRSTFSP